MAIRLTNDKQLQILNDDDDRVQILLRRTDVGDVPEEELEEYPLALIAVDREETPSGPLDHTFFSTITHDEAMALRDYLNEYLISKFPDEEEE